VKRSILIILVNCIFTFYALAVTQNIILQNDNSNNISINEKNWQGLSLEIDIAEINASSLQTPWGNFTQINLPNYSGQQLDIGKANLPTINQLIDLPYNAEVSIEVLSYETEEILLENFGFTEPIIPYQGRIPKTENAIRDHIFQMDDGYYNTKHYQSQPLMEFMEVGNLRGHRLGQIKINSVQYSPVENKIKVYKNVKLKVNFLNADISQTESIHKKYHSPYFVPLLQEYLINYKSIESDLTQYPIHYAIIYYDAFETVLEPFFEWKKQKGFFVTATKISNIGNNTAAITNHIQNLYNGSNPPSFVLLVGDKEQINAHDGQTDNHVTDLYYTTMTIGDYLPDLYIGRLSAQIEAHLTAQLNKILPYEKYQFPQTAFLNHGCFPATSDGGFNHIAEGTHNYVIDTHFIPDNLLYDKLYAITYGSTGQDVINTLNAGRFILNYSGHGSRTSWGGPSVSQSMVNASINTDMYPFVISNSWLTGSFQITECFGETWVRKANGGGLAFTGASNNTMWNEDDEWERRAYDGTFWENYYSLAAFIFRGNLGVLNAGYSAAQYYFEVYHLFGDPSVMLYWGEASQMAVNCNPVIPLGSADFTVDVTGEDSALVSLYMNGELSGLTLTDANGTALVQFANPPVTVGDMILTVTKFNRQPFIDTLQVIVPSFVSIQPDTLQINTPTIVNVTVMDADTLSPESGVQIWAEGVGYVSDTTVTDSAGFAAVIVNYPFGPDLMLKGKRPADNYFLFTDTLIVAGGVSLDSSDLWISTNFGLNDKFAKNLPGTLHKFSNIQGTDLYYTINNVEWISTTVDSITFTPEVIGEVTGVIAKTGYDIYTETFPIILADGYLSGTISDTSGAGLSNVTVQVFNDTLLLGTTTSNASGLFTYPDSLPVANYQIKINHFGYLSIDTTLFIGYGQNQYSLTMDPALSGLVSGTIMEDGTTIPIQATAKFYRADNLQLYQQTTSDTLGNYSIDLPFFIYKMVASAMGYKSSVSIINIDSLYHTINVNLESGVDNYVYDFENDNGGFTGTASWQWGALTNGPGSAYQGVNVWATNLAGNYGSGEHSELITPELNLAGFSNPKLKFAHWYDIEEYFGSTELAYDGGNVKISTDGGSNFSVIDPLGGYQYTISTGGNILDGQGVFSATSAGWELAEFDLSAYAGMEVLFKFDFGSDESLTYAGWYVDSVVVSSQATVPQAPTSLMVLDSNEVVRLAWNDVTKNLLNEKLIFKVRSQEDLQLQQDKVRNSGNSVTNLNNNKADSYNIYRSSDGITFNLTESTTDTMYSDTTVTVGNTYYYYVTALASGLESEPSDTVSVTVQTLSGIFDDWGKGVPTTFAIEQNYPNPFNPVTTIRYQLPKANHVKLEVFTITGQKVKTLVNENQAANYHTIQWNGLNETGSRIASGIYLFRIEAGEFVKTQKMLLLK